MIEMEKEKSEIALMGTVDLMITVLFVVAVAFFGYWFFYKYVAEKVAIYFLGNGNMFLVGCVRNYISCVFSFGLALVVKNRVFDLYMFAKRIAPIKMFLLAIVGIIFVEVFPTNLKFLAIISLVLVVRYGILNDNE